MTFWPTVGLGLRLAAGGGRKGLVRLLLMAVGVGLGVALVIGGLGIAPALAARHAREDARSPVFAEGVRPDDYLYWNPTSDRIGDRDVVRFTVAAVGHAPVPPGITRVPAPGEMFASPALARLLDTPLGRIAVSRFRGRIVGLVQQPGLAYPDELVVYVGAPRSFFRTIDSPPIVSFNARPGPGTPVPFGVKLLILLGVAGLLIPTLVFVATSTRLSAASRERRLAAIRLVGATPRQARLLAAVESGVSAVLGSAIGLGLFFAVRPVVAGMWLAGYQWFPSDIAPPLWSAIAVVVAAPLLAMGAAVVALRRLIVTPLGVLRRARVRRAGPVRLVPLAAGAGGLGLCWLARGTVNRGGAGSLILVGGSFILVLLGLAAVAPWLGSAVTPLLARGERGLGWLLGARRPQADPTAAGRVVGAMALLVFAAGVVQALTPSFRGGGGDVAMSLKPTAALVEGDSLDTELLRRSLRDVPGVRTVVPLAMVESRTGGPGGEAPVGFSAWIANCTDLRRVLTVLFPGCTSETGYVTPFTSGLSSLRPGAILPVRLDGWEGSRRAAMRIGGPIRRAPLVTGEWQLGTDVILPPAWFSHSAAQQLRAYRTLVLTDWTTATMERLRNAMARVSSWASVRTRREAEAELDRTAHQASSLVDLGVVVALGIALANLLIVSIDHVQERRMAVAMLAASGVPLSILRRSVTVEVGAPLVLAVGFAMALAVAVAETFGAIVSEPLSLRFGPLAILGLLTVATAAVVSALTFPGAGPGRPPGNAPH